MILNSKTTQRDRWQHQAQHLTLVPTATTTDAATEQVRRRQSSFDEERERVLELSEPTPAGASSGTNRSELEQRLERVKAATWILNARKDKLAAQVKAADKRITELEAELKLTKTTLTATEAERNKLAAKVKEANNTRLAEANTQNARLEAALARAATAEKLLAEARQALLSRTVEASRAVTKLADVTTAHKAAEEKLKPLQDALRVKEGQVHELEQARSKLMEGAGASLRTSAGRDTVLASAEERPKSPSSAQAKAVTSPPKVQQTIQGPHARPDRDSVGRTVPQGIRKKARADHPLLKRDLDKDDWLLGAR